MHPGLYKSIDEGRTWRRVVSEAVVDMVVRRNEMLVLTTDGTLLRSSDAEAFTSWGRVPDGFSYVTALEIDHLGRALFGTEEDGVLRTLTSVEIGIVERPTTSFILRNNYPDPFHSVTTISFELPSAGHVTLEVFDVLGRRVRTVVEGVVARGRTDVDFDAGSLPGGLYVYRLTFGQRHLTGTMIVTR